MPLATPAPEVEEEVWEDDVGDEEDNNEEEEAENEEDDEETYKHLTLLKNQTKKGDFLLINCVGSKAVICISKIVGCTVTWNDNGTEFITFSVDNGDDSFMFRPPVTEDGLDYATYAVEKFLDLMISTNDKETIDITA